MALWGRIAQDWVGCEVGWATRHSGSHRLELRDEPALICQQLPRMSSLGLVAGAFLPHSQPCPTLPYHSPPRSRRESSALLPCPTSAYPILPHPTPAYTVSSCRPNLVLHWILLRSYPDATQQPSPRLAPLAGLLH